MAKANSNKKSNNSKNNSVSKKTSANSITANKKVSGKKKKIVIDDKVKSSSIKETEMVKKNTTKKTSSINSKKAISTNSTIDTNEIRKERNRKKYQNQQKKYQDSQKNKVKKTIAIDDIVKEDKAVNAKENSLVKKEKKVSNKEKIRKEKRKNNRKGIHFTQTLVNLKDKGFDKINLVKEKTNDKYIPVGKTKEEKKQRFKRLIKESIIYAILLTTINVLCILIFDYFNFLRLFDIKSLNIVITILISLIFNFFVAFMIDYFITEIWLKKRRKKEDGVEDGDSWFNKRKHRKNIKNKERE